MSEAGEQVTLSHDDAVAEQRRQARGGEREGVLQHEDQLAQRMDAAPLADATMFQESFPAGLYGKGSAVAVIMLLLLIPIMIVNIRRFREEAAR